MSLVKIQGNASGTGVFTIEAPNSDTNRTLSIPDTAGNLVTTGDTGTVSTDMLADTSITNAKVATNFLRFDLLASGSFTGNFTLSETSANFDMLFVHYDLSTGTQTIATSSSTDDDWERTLWLSPYNLTNGFSYTESTDRDKFTAIGTTFYYYRTATNNIVRQVWGVKFRGT